MMETQETLSQEELQNNNKENNTDSNVNTNNTNINNTGGSLLPDNPDDKTCYCGKDRNLGECEFQCGMCLRFYHHQCISCYQGDFVPFMTNYQFFCKRCSSHETLTKKTSNFGQLCLTAIANLMHTRPGEEMFSRDADIIPYIDNNWELMTSAPRRIKNTWHSSVSKTMLKDPSIFSYKEENQMFGLVNQDLKKIGPNCESLIRLLCSNKLNDTKSSVSSEVSRGRTTKRKAPNDNLPLNSAKHKRNSELSLSMKLTPNCYPLEHPFNKDGYRYHLAEPDPHAPNWQVFDESPEWAGKPIPGYLYRLNIENKLLLSLNDRAPQLKVAESRLTVTGEKGYSMIRATHGVSKGSWYFEVTIDEMKEGSASRIGWSQALGNLQAPCGYDKFSYSWRSRKGTRFHQSHGHHYSEQGHGEGDVLGFLIHLPNTPVSSDAPYYKDKPLVKFKSHLYYEEKDLVTEAEKKLKQAPGSKIVMYLNGISQGVAFEDLYQGTYFPAISLYKNTTVTVNFGPTFKQPPKDTDFNPMSIATEKEVIRHALGDIIYHIEHEGQTLEV